MRRIILEQRALSPLAIFLGPLAKPESRENSQGFSPEDGLSLEDNV